MRADKLVFNLIISGLGISLFTYCVNTKGSKKIKAV